MIALLPGLGLIVWFVVCIYGIGAVSMAAWYGGHERPVPDAPAAPSPPEPPDEPTAPAAPPEPPEPVDAPAT